MDQLLDSSVRLTRYIVSTTYAPTDMDILDRRWTV